jgi:hypothetical protein
MGLARLVDLSPLHPTTWLTLTKKPTKGKRAKKQRIVVTKPKARKPEKPFPFLSLPAELRDQIYELALVEPEGITVVSRTKSYRRTITRGHIADHSRYYYPRRRRNQVTDSQSDTYPQTKSLSPNLLAVNKQIRAEASGYLYQQTIVLEDTMTLHTFLAAIGHQNRLRLSDIVVKGWGGGRGAHKASNFASLTALAGCTNLKSFMLDCDIGWLRSPKHLARQLFRDGHYFLEAFGAANGKKDAALGVLQLGDSNYDKTRYAWRQRSIPEREEFQDQFDAEMRKLMKC